ncbi:unnamed protein product [Rhizoctonia solani]|uniref:FAS1 domain-containing protein n=1 Tax=Rhizoctonia solani TaxID=456999 RepID=A0A8H2XT95_9AGAM|nr:unnamed protein product [Rhizoctonia solani]
MKFLAQVVPALFAVSSFVHASAVIPRSGGDDFLHGFFDALYKNNLTILADNYKRIAETKEGKPVIEALKNGPTTLLAPKDCAFGKDNTKIDPNVLLFNTLPGSIDENFKSDHSTITRRGAVTQSRSAVRTSFRRPSSITNSKKRQNAGSFQSNMVNQLTGGGRKRWNDRTILIEQAVGHAEVVDRFTYKDLIILIIDDLISLPGSTSELLCKPLIEDAPNGFGKFGEALKKTGIADMADTKDAITIFALPDESLDNIDKLSKDDLTCLLENHFIVGQTVYTPEFLSVHKATANSGKELKFFYQNDIHYVSCGKSKSKSVVVRGDVITSTGVMHVIDRPLKCD